MATKKPSNNWNFKGVIKCELSKSDKMEYKLWLEGQPDVDSWLLKLMEDGYKTTLSYDDYQSCHQASMTPKANLKLEHEGWLLVGRGSTPWRAICNLLYKHLVMLKGSWHNATDRMVDGMEDWE